jgi:nicotinamide mononucleotide transporter
VTGFIAGLFDLRVVMVELMGYRLSYLEFLGTATGLACVWLTAREKVWCWPAGLVNAAFFFAMFFQLRLYSDMLLQVYYLATSVYGWWKWTHPRSPDEANRRNELRISLIPPRKMLALLAGCLAAVVAFGTFISNVHVLLPRFFPEKAAFPYADSAVAVLSVFAQFIMARKKLECWLLWISVDVLATGVYFLKGANLLALEYLVFGGIALYGFLGWRREHQGYKSTEATA